MVIGNLELREVPWWFDYEVQDSRGVGREVARVRMTIGVAMVFGFEWWGFGYT